MQSFTSPNLQKYSFKPSAKTGGEMRLDDPRTSEPTSPLRAGPAEVMCWQGLGADNGGRADHVVFVPPPNPPEEPHGLSGHSAQRPIRPNKAAHGDGPDVTKNKIETGYDE